MVEALVLFVVVLGMNVVPAFMPPTWVVLAFYYGSFDLPLFFVVAIGATAAALGRLALYRIARDYLRPRFSGKGQANLDNLKRFVHNHERISVPAVVAYAFLPIPSNQVFITAGLARINIRLLAFSFFFGRVLSYTFWVYTTNRISDNLGGIFGQALTNTATVALDLAGLIFVFGLSLVDWERLLKITKKKTS